LLIQAQGAGYAELTDADSAGLAFGSVLRAIPIEAISVLYVPYFLRWHPGEDMDLGGGRDRH